jgi:hypothetical protein
MVNFKNFQIAPLATWWPQTKLNANKAVDPTTAADVVSTASAKQAPAK